MACGRAGAANPHGRELVGRAMEHTKAVRMVLPERMDIAATELLVRDLLAVRGQPIALDASEVKKLGGRCLQVLISAHITWLADKATLQIESPSSLFKDALVDFGASHILNVAVKHV